MTATITIGDGGQINLPEALKVVFGVKPGVRLRAEVTADRIEIVKDIPLVTEGVLENGVLVLPRLGIPMDAAADMDTTPALRDRARKGVIGLQNHGSGVEFRNVQIKVL